MISVLIPARNEEFNLPRLLTRLQSMPEIGEMIVADGGSTDDTVRVARALGATVVEGAKGRGAQQNLAAQSASGEVLWFLHADSLPSKGCARQIMRQIHEGAPGGNFRLRFDARGFWPRLFEFIARTQRVLGIYYGDSGLWVTRDTWDRLDGFQAWPLFEDLDFARRLEKMARLERKKTVCCAGRLLVSARRFEKSPARVLWQWGCLQIAYEFGVSIDKLARLYHGMS